MHEVGMAFDIVDIIDRFAEARNIPFVQRVYVTVGEYAGIIPAALQLGFEAARDASEHCVDAQLVIERVAGCVVCDNCRREFHPDAPSDTCPQCGSCCWSVLAGGEFKIAAIDHA